MRTGMKLNDGTLVYQLMCERCRGSMVFDASVQRDDAINKLLLNHNWKKEKNKIYCDGCSKILDEDKPKKKSKLSKKNSKNPPPKKASKEEDADGYIEL